MSVTLACRITQENTSMYTAGFVASTSFYSSPRSNKRGRPLSPGKECRLTGSNSPSPCRVQSGSGSGILVKSPGSSGNSPLRPVQGYGRLKCKDKSTMGLVNELSKLTLKDNNKPQCSTVWKDLKLTEKILNTLPMEPLPIGATDLEEKLCDNATTVKPLIVDCRSFISYNLCHIKNALNIGCADRFTRRRLQSGKVTLTEMIKCSLSKEKFLSHKGTEVVVYDDSSSETLEKDSGLRILVTHLLREGKTVYFLKGGLVEFSSRFEELCEKPDQPPSNAPIYSPTTPAIVSDEINTAVASEILPFLFIGNEKDAADLQRLREHGITHVLNITSHIPMYFEKEGILYHRLPANDSSKQNLKQYFQQASDFIDQVKSEGGKVLVHCQAGVSRSATITMAYIIKHSHLTLNDVYKFVKSKRSIIAPNFNFMGQLMEFEQAFNEGQISRSEDICISNSH